MPLLKNAPQLIWIFAGVLALHGFVMFRMAKKRKIQVGLSKLLLRTAIFPLSLFSNYRLVIKNSTIVAGILVFLYLFFFMEMVGFASIFVLKDPTERRWLKGLFLGLSYMLPIWDVILWYTQRARLTDGANSGGLSG